MTRLERLSIIDVLRSQHRRASKLRKGEIITETCERLNVCRKQAIRLLSPKNVGRPKKPVGRGRPSKYQDAEFVKALKLFWKLSRFVCGRRLKQVIPLWFSYVEEEFGVFAEPERAKLLSISAATIDRILKPYKVMSGPSLTSNGGFRSEIPIGENLWDIKSPGYLEVDTVAHCGGSLAGEFINSLTAVDIATLWTEVRAVFGRGSNAVLDAVKDIEVNLPFKILAYDADNGGEVLNRQLYNYFTTERLAKGQEPVIVTRARPYKKNDNAHVEQRNDSIARKYLQYNRLAFAQLVPLVNYYYTQIVCPLHNYFLPSFKLADKIRIKSKTRRVYNNPETPYQRLLKSDQLSAQQKFDLTKNKDLLNPIKLVRQEAIVRRQIDEINRRLQLSLKLPEDLPTYKLKGSLLEL